MYEEACTLYDKVRAFVLSVYEYFTYVALCLGELDFKLKVILTL